ncbi:MAG: hypothetical protein ACREI3_01005, partial [Nitrospirales bacterium]
MMASAQEFFCRFACRAGRRCRVGMGLVVSVWLMLWPHPGLAQPSLPPDMPDAFDPIVKGMQFDEPTRIAGRLLSIDPYEEALWIEWTHQHERGQWLPVPFEITLRLYPRDAEMMAWMRGLERGASLRVVVQRDETGKRRILRLDDLLRWQIPFPGPGSP